MMLEWWQVGVVLGVTLVLLCVAQWLYDKRKGKW